MHTYLTLSIDQYMFCTNHVKWAKSFFFFNIKRCITILDGLFGVPKYLCPGFILSCLPTSCLCELG